MILCAALKIQIEDLKEPTIIPCWRHAKGYEILHDMGIRHPEVEEGFILSENGEFLNRHEAFQYVVDHKQLPYSLIWYKKDSGENELYSEDLY